MKYEQKNFLTKRVNSYSVICTDTVKFIIIKKK